MIDLCTRPDDTTQTPPATTAGRERTHAADGARPLWVLEDTSSHSSREDTVPSRTSPIALRLYRVANGVAELAAEHTYRAGDLQGKLRSRVAIVLQLLDRAGVAEGIFVGSHRSGGGPTLVRALNSHGLQFVLEIPKSARLRFRNRGRPLAEPTAESRLRRVKWEFVDPRPPHPSSARYAVAHLGPVEYAGVDRLDCYALSSGGIEGYSRGVLVGVASLGENAALQDVAHLLGWVRWVRTIARRTERSKSVRPVGESGRDAVVESAAKAAQFLLNLPVRANLQIARRIDEQAAAERSAGLFAPEDFRGQLTVERKALQVVELFAGAGGMGLGFLNAKREDGRRYKVIASGEIHPIYTHTLAHNHRFLRDQKLVPEDAVPECCPPMDLRTAEAADRIRSVAQNAGGVDVLIGGPPCQGFSSANRNSWSSSNPNNQLVDTFIDYVEMLRPRVFLMENVQGILWTPKSGRDSGELSVAEHVVARLAAVGYHIHVKLLDAAWYGVPQHRSRFFLLGIHKELGYSQDVFGAWGPFPAPTHGPGTQHGYATVADAIRDLPEMANGEGQDELSYAAPEPPADSLLAFLRHGAPGEVIWDHVASRHADYVIERYRRIPPGGNWQDVAEMMTNYADVDRTHSNIYRRLMWDDPSITIGHYRKSMIVHPSQHRGLSLREAARLQSFPDWFRFAGSPRQLRGGLSYKQQQLANAVCPLVTRAVAEFVLDL